MCIILSHKLPTCSGVNKKPLAGETSWARIENHNLLWARIQNLGFGQGFLVKNACGQQFKSYMLNCKISGTVHIFFFLKSIAQPPVNETAPIFF